MLAPGWISMPVTKRLNWLIQRGSDAARRRSAGGAPGGAATGREARQYEVTISSLEVAAGSRSCTARTSLVISADGGVHVAPAGRR